MTTKITIFDGARSIGGTKAYLEDKNTGILLDFGVNYKKWGQYYEEYLKPRTSKGLHDLLRLKVVPPIAGIYRKDLFPEGLSESSFPYGIKVDAVFTTHAHLDHCGHIGLLNKDIPVYASIMTSVLMKAIQDCGSLDFDRDIVYIRPRCQTENGTLKSRNWQKYPYIQRQFFTVNCSSDINTPVQEFWQTPPNPTGRGRSLDSKPLKLGSSKVGHIQYKAFFVDHSIFGASAYAFQTSSGWVVYTGDFRQHGQNQEFTKQFIQEAAKLSPRALIIEGTHLNQKRSKTESTVLENCLKEVKKVKGKLVIADFAARNFERLLTFLEIAKVTGRKLVILAKDAYLLKAMRLVDASLPDVLKVDSLRILEEYRSSPGAWEKHVVKKEYQDKYVTTKEVDKNQGDYILSLSFWSIKQMLDIQPEPGSIYLYSTSEAFTEEQEVDTLRLWNWITKLRLKPIGFTIPEEFNLQSKSSNPAPVFDKNYHSSGHISGEEILKVIRRIQPHIVIPVHTEKPEFFQDKLGNEIEVIIPEKPQSIQL